MGMNALEVRRRVMLAQPHEAAVTGAIASFRTDVVSPLPFEFDLNPVQDLHGYDSPWPGGGGKNLFNKDTATLGARIGPNGQEYIGTGYYSSDYIPVLASHTYTKNSPTADAYHRFATYNAEKVFQRVVNTNTVTLTAGEFFVRFCGLQTEMATAQLEAGSSSTTFAHYSNICPITGHDGFTRTGTGKNLFDGEVYKRAFVAQSATTAHIESNNNWRSIYARVEGGKTYTISRTTIEANRFRMVATVDEPTVGEDAIILNNSADNDSLYAVTVTIPDGYNYLFVYLSNQSATITPGNYQIELGSHGTTIVPYQGHSYSTTFPTPPGTVYGCHVRGNGDGTYDLTVNRAYVDLTTLDWRLNTAHNYYFSSSLAGIAKSYPDNVPNNTLAENYIAAPSRAGGLWPTAAYISLNNNQNLYFNSTTPPTGGFVYELATPVQYTGLTLTALQSLIGLNHIWVDNAESVSVEYWGH